MSWRTSFRLAWSNLSRRPARTLLTVLGVAVSSALLVALGSIASVAESRAIEHFGQGLPVGAIKVEPEFPAPWQLQTDEFQGRGPKDLDDSALQQIRELPNVRSVVPIQATPVLVVPPAQDSFTGTMVGTDLSLSGDLPVSVLAGRLPQAGSLTEVAVTRTYLEHAHPGEADAAAVGDELLVGEPQAQESSELPVKPRWFRARVVGVVSDDISGADLLVPLRQSGAARAWELAGGALPGSQDSLDLGSPYSGLIVVASSVETLHGVRAGIDGIGYATSAPEKILGAVLRYLHVVDIVLAGIGSIAVFVAGLNIANSLLAAVRERRREIGVLKAIGASDRDVLRWFFTEATLTGLAGGLVGTLAGALMAQALAARVADYLSQQGVSMEALQLGEVPWGVLLAGILGSWLLALVAAALPALRAVRLPATEAMAEL